MAYITTCSKCSGLYESGSDEQSNEPDRLCPECFKASQPVHSPLRDYENLCEMLGLNPAHTNDGRGYR